MPEGAQGKADARPWRVLPHPGMAYAYLPSESSKKPGRRLLCNKNVSPGAKIEAVTAREAIMQRVSRIIESQIRYRIWIEEHKKKPSMISKK